MELITVVLLLGVAGLDFSGAMIVITAYTLGADKKDVFTFALVDFIGTVTIGVACSFILGEHIDLLVQWVNSFGVIFELVVVGLLLVWLVRRVFYKKEEAQDFLKTYLDKGLMSVGIGFSIGALTDPSFIALITLAGYNMNFIEIVLAHCVWILISQLPAFVLTIAVISGKYEQMNSFIKERIEKYRWIKKIKNILPKLLTVIILIIALLLTADSVGYFLVGKRLISLM